MTVYETDVPGVGHKYELELDGAERLVVLIHHDGKREIFRRPGPDEDAEKLFDLSGKTARKLGAILEGVYFQPVELDDTEIPLGNAIIKWVEVDPASPLQGVSIRESGIRKETGVSVIAIQRGETTIPNPDPSTELRADDVLVTLGTHEEQRAVAKMLADDGAATS